LTVGLILSGIFAVSWKYFGDIYFTESTRLRLVPSAMVLLVSSVLGFKQLLGLAVTVDRLALAEPPAIVKMSDALQKISLAGVLAVVLAILVKFAALLAMPNHVLWWPGDWRRYFNPLYPRIPFRVLILFGLWAKCGLLIASATGAQSQAIAEPDRALRRATSIKALLISLIAVTALTTIYFSSAYNRAIGLLLSLWMFVVLYLASMLLSRRQGGHDGFSMHACAELGETALLMGYLAIARYL
jgi:cobalamin synthase